MGMGFEYWEVGFEKKLGWEMGSVHPPFRTLFILSSTAQFFLTDIN